MARTLISMIDLIRVSSVLNSDVKQFGKQFLTDGNEETCWNSNQSAKRCGQWIGIGFSEGVIPEELQLVFQGGFAGKTCELHVCFEDQDTFTSVMDFLPKDDNSRQVFPIGKLEKKVIKLKIKFLESTDFYGRITVYDLDILGRK